MSSCCLMDISYMLLLMLLNKDWRNRLSCGLQQGGRLRCLLMLVEILYRSMLHWDTTHLSMRKAHFHDLELKSLL